jgi:hypothetical protein
MVIGTSTFTQEPWSGSTIAFANYGSIGTQGSYRASWSWNWERGTDSGYHALGINSYTSAAGVEMGNTGILFRADATYGATAPPTTRMILTPAGNVGIGTTSPQTALEVENGIITSRSTASGTTSVGTDKGIALVCADMNTSSQFTPGLLFGSTDSAFTTTNPKYNAGIFGRADETYGSDTDTGMSIQMRFAGTNAGTGHGVTGAYGYAFGPTVIHSQVDNVADLGLSVRRWNDAYVTNGVTTGSDERDKTNITDLDLGLEFVDSLRPVSWTWNDRSGYVGTRKHMGFVAQEIAATLGDDASDRGVWIHTESTEETDEEGNTVTTLDRQGLRYSELMAPMVKAIQELSALNTAQQTTIEALEGRIAALEAE